MEEKRVIEVSSEEKALKLQKRLLFMKKRVAIINKKKKNETSPLANKLVSKADVIIKIN